MFPDGLPGAVQLPTAFCWTKFGPESGEAADAILARKEHERTVNSGVFLGGIGNSIWPSLQALLREDVAPEVLFSPMSSRAHARDSAPAHVLTWRRATGLLDDQEFPIPSGSKVTSRPSARAGRKHHFALVCHSDNPVFQDVELTLPVWTLRNLVKGTVLGGSQVTSVVRRLEPSDASAGRVYPVRARARLVAPFLLRLEDPVRSSSNN